MPRRTLCKTPVTLAPGFDHEASELVDVFEHPYGQFVQVWDKGRKHVLLSYRRTSAGPDSISITELFDSGKWKAIETFGDKKTFWYRDKSRETPPAYATRFEWTLPSGRLLVADLRNHLSLKHIFTAAFDWLDRKPKGRSLGDQAILQRQSAGVRWFISTYQGTCGKNELSSKLRCVEEFLGRDRMRIVEI